MASVSQVAPGHDRPGVRFERVSAGQRRMALAVLLTGEPTARDASVDQFLRYVRDESLSLEELWLAWDEGRPAAATLIVPCAGRTAMQFVGPASAWSSDRVAAALFRHAAEAQDRRRIALIQALLEPDQPRTRAALERAGFEELAVLTYMRARAAERPHTLRLVEASLADARVLHWTEANRPAFARAILASYEQTLDCPGLLGRRRIEDIIAGHMSAGRFRPELWHAVYRGDDPVAVVLVNENPPSDAMELVYLGVARAWRGRGLGRRLVRYALGETVRYGRSRLLLAVDERNEPAYHLYRDLGFYATGRKRAMIFSLT